MSVEMVCDEEPRIKKNQSDISVRQVEMWDKTSKGGGMLQSGSSMLRGVTDGGRGGGSSEQ
jgi:hypothetical protein